MVRITRLHGASQNSAGCTCERNASLIAPLTRSGAPSIPASTARHASLGAAWLPSQSEPHSLEEQAYEVSCNDGIGHRTEHCRLGWREATSAAGISIVARVEGEMQADMAGQTVQLDLLERQPQIVLVAGGFRPGASVC
ncbi:hypothetical protein [Xanthomonas vasicola]|uniref:hypothetical protein n=1 Tax=Xanthomonas vasicola TaxID=56459 RepID=UPI000F8533AC|nr:hypothetical protein [Xanthomonas vasicola]AZR34983.1 hypothetical protein NX08_011385 [Xanthomonas vasicola]